MRKIYMFSILLSVVFVNSSFGLVIDKDEAEEIQMCLEKKESCEYPARNDKGLLIDEDINVKHNITWRNNHSLTLITQKNIIIDKEAYIENTGNGTLNLKAGMENLKNVNDNAKNPEGTVIFNDDSYPHLHMKEGVVSIYYNPTKADKKHKYFNSQSYLYEKQLSDKETTDIYSYMLVNNIEDLQDIRKALFLNYALSQDIEAINTKTWDEGKGFRPLKEIRQYMVDGEKKENIHGFCGYFDGNNYIIHNLYINRPQEDYVGLFGVAIALENKKSRIENLFLLNSNIVGDTYVSNLVGYGKNLIIKNVAINGANIDAQDIAGGIIATGRNVFLDSVRSDDTNILTQQKNKGLIMGVGYNIEVILNYSLKDNALFGHLMDDKGENLELHSCIKDQNSFMFTNFTSVASKLNDCKIIYKCNLDKSQLKILMNGIL